jgi:hypothetical protein
LNARESLGTELQHMYSRTYSGSQTDDITAA